MATDSAELAMNKRRFPWRLIFEVFTAVVGGYLFANAASIFLIHVLPMFRGDAFVIGMLLTFVFYILAIIWVFAHRSLWRGSGMLWLAVLILSGLSWVLGG